VLDPLLAALGGFLRVLRGQVLSPIAEADPVEVAELAASARGEGGFGSSGR